VDEVSSTFNGEFALWERAAAKARLPMLVACRTPTSANFAGGQDVTAIQGDKLKEYRRHAQIVFQNPFEAFDPRRTVGDSLDQALRIHNLGNTDERARRIAMAMEQAGLTPVDDFLERYPHELSGAKPRIATVRAMLLAPALCAVEP